VVTVYSVRFEGGEDWFTELHRRLERSIRKNMPTATVEMEVVDPPESLTPIERNHYKFLRWVDFVERTPGKLILLDGDIIVNGDLEEAFGEFDVAITERSEGAAMPLNGGVVFLNDTEGAREFMRRWLKWEHEYHDNQEQYRDWYHIYYGPNQTALGLLLEYDADGIEIAKLPCRKWNACEDDYPYCKKAKAVHIKSARARRAMTNGVEWRYMPPEFHELYAVWRKY